MYTSYHMTNDLKMDNRPKCKNKNYTTARRKHKRKSLQPWVRPIFLRYDNKSTAQPIKEIN